MTFLPFLARYEISCRINEKINWLKDEIKKWAKPWIENIWDPIKKTVLDAVKGIKNGYKALKDQVKNMLMSTLEKTFKIQKLKDDFNECKEKAEAAIEEIDDAKDTIVKIFEDQMDRLKKGEVDCVIEALKSVVDESGETFKKIEKATGCIAQKFGYKAYSLSVGLSKGWYCLLSLSLEKSHQSIHI